jgi:hypothetical protein
MAPFEKRTTYDGKTVYRVKVRRKGTPLQAATFARLSDAKNGRKSLRGLSWKDGIARRLRQSGIR